MKILRILSYFKRPLSTNIPSVVNGRANDYDCVSGLRLRSLYTRPITYIHTINTMNSVYFYVLGLAQQQGFPVIVSHGLFILKQSCNNALCKT